MQPVEEPPAHQPMPPDPPPLHPQCPIISPPPPMTPHYYLPMPQYQPPLASATEFRTLWIGNLQHWMDENYLRGCFTPAGDDISVKIIHNKQTMQSEGYGFIKFGDHATAKQVLQTYNGQMMPNADQPYRLNWATIEDEKYCADGPSPPHYYHLMPQYQLPLDSTAEIRTLWIGNLQLWMNETYLLSCFAPAGEVISIKVIHNKQTVQSKGYGFIKFGSRATAEQVLQAYNGQIMPNTDQPFKLNWATIEDGKYCADYTIFVGDLASDVTDYMLKETFRSHYHSVKGASVVTDKATGCSKGYGFVRFGDLNEQTRAMTEMNGMFCSTRPMRIRPAVNKSDTQQQYVTEASSQTTTGSDSENDPNNTTIFVDDLDPKVTEDVLRKLFKPYGDLIHVKIPVGKHCGFVQFSNRDCADEALLMLNGALVGGQNIRLSWGHGPLDKQIFVDCLDPNVTEDVLRQLFKSYGDLVHVKIPVGKRCGFVQFSSRSCAEEALLMLNGVLVGGQNILLSWGNNPSIKQPKQDPNLLNSNFYRYGRGYDPFGYGPPPQNLNMYAYAANPGCRNYQQV